MIANIKNNVSLAVVVRDTQLKFSAVTRIRTWVVAATTRSTNHYTITASALTGRRRFLSNILLTEITLEHNTTFPLNILFIILLLHIHSLVSFL